MHNFVVVNSLVVLDILGVDFLQTNGVQLDFSTAPVNIDICKASDCFVAHDDTTMAIYKAKQANKIKQCPI